MIISETGKVLLEAMLRQPYNGFLHKFCDSSVIGCNNDLLKDLAADGISIDGYLKALETNKRPFI